MKLSKRTLMVALLLVTAAAMLALGPGRSGPAGIGYVRQMEVAASQEEMDAEAMEMMENAMSAAPASLAENATILSNEVDADGNSIVLREGTNGWYCSPDAPGTPGMDPMCFDQTWMDWVTAFGAGEEPDTKVVGLAYMLQGGSDASNTDPFATEPAEGDEWMTSPPHVMLIMPGPIDMTVYTADHHTGGPWVMWAGTPYEHVMMPVEDAEGGM